MVSRRVPAVAVSEVEVSYGPRATIGPISFELEPGAVLGLIGGNGSGKTTVLRTLCALQTVSRGTVRVYGEPVSVGRPVRRVGAMIEEPRFYGWLSGRDNLLMAAGGRRDWAGRTDPTLDDVGLTEAAEVPVGEYSQGMRQRLGVARALLGDPRLLILDEPSNGMDAPSMRQIRGVLQRTVARGTALILTTHLIAEVEALAHRVCVMNAGSALCVAEVSKAVTEAGSLDTYYQRLLADPP